MMAHDLDRWCILRTSAGKTLPLASSLVDAGLDAWTPVASISRRIPRSKARQVLAAPIMPTFVFARERHIDELMQARAMPINPYPGFSIFHHLGRIPLLDDREIDVLRTEERRAAPRSQRATFIKGARVKVPEGSFTGMSGVVEDEHGGFTFVSFGGNMRVKIATFLLRSDDVEHRQPHSGTAAAAA